MIRFMFKYCLGPSPTLLPPTTAILLRIEQGSITTTWWRNGSQTSRRSLNVEMSRSCILYKILILPI